MSTVTIPQLPMAISLAGAEQMEAVQAGVSVRFTTALLAQYVATFVIVPAITTFPQVTKTANYALNPLTDYYVLCTTNAFTLTLPSAIGLGGKTFVLLNGNTGASGHYISLATVLGQTVSLFSSPYPIAPGAVSITVWSDNANWWVS